MPDLISEFAAEYFVLNSISEHRRVHVQRILRNFEAFAQKPAHEASDAELRQWLVAMLESGLAPSSVKLYLRMVGPFYTWCWEHHYISAERLMRMRSVRPPRGSGQQTPRPYSRKELARMWRELDERFPYAPERIVKRFRNGTSPLRSVRRHAMRLQLDAIIELALVCGLRKSEIYKLSIDDCHWDNKYVVVQGKRVDQNPKVREVPYPESTREAVQRWWRMRALLSPEPGAPLWLSVTGPDPAAPLSMDRMDDILHSFGDWTLHRLRHTCATERLRAGMELEKLQRFLGHASLQQTLGYTKLVRSDIHKSSERTDADFQRAVKPHRRAA